MLTQYKSNFRNDILKQSFPRTREHKCKRFGLKFNDGLWESLVISRRGSWSQIWVNLIISGRGSGSQINYWDASSAIGWILCLNWSRITNGISILFCQIINSINFRNIRALDKVPAKTVLKAWWEHFKADLITQSYDSNSLH